MSDSLVRVSRRVIWNHFINIGSVRSGYRQRKLNKDPNRSRPRKEPVTTKPLPKIMSVITADATPNPSSIRIRAMLPPINNMSTKVPPGRHHLSAGLLFGSKFMLIRPSKEVHVPGINRCWILDRATPKEAVSKKPRTELISQPLIPRREKTMTGCKCFPFNNFKYYLTLSPEFFSPFPHGTCVLSVSCRYQRG